MSNPNRLGGIIHTYQKYDPVQFPSPTAEPPDLVSPIFEHMLEFGSIDDLTEEELAQAIRLDPRQIQGLGPSLNALIEMLKQRKQKILATFETDQVQREAAQNFHTQAESVRPPEKLVKRFHKAVKQEQLYDLERLYYAVDDERGKFARQLIHLVETLGEKYQVEELAAKYDFTGQQAMTVPQALEIKQELETIDKLIEQLKEAKKTAQIAIIDLDELQQFSEPGDIERLQELQRQIEEYMRAEAERQGLTPERGSFQLSPKAYRLFQTRLLQVIFSQLEAARSGRHNEGIIGEGAIESQKTKPYEFGDSVSQMDIPASMVNALLRQGNELPVRLRTDDIVIHETKNNPKCATTVLLDMSGSMRYDRQYVNVKRMGLALDGLIRREFPGDYLQFLEIFTFAKPRHISEIPTLLPKPVTIYSPVVRLRQDMSDPDITEVQVPPHFTNIQHGLQLSRRFLSSQDTPNRQVILITDGLPTAHFEGELLYLLYPPDRRTEDATMREALLCAREGITINIFLLSSWNQSEEDIRFAYRMAESTNGRVFFSTGRDLDRCVVWDYITRRKQIYG